MSQRNQSTSNWPKKHHGSRKQAEVIDFIEKNLSLVAPDYDIVLERVPLDPVLQQCERDCGVSKSTVRRWWKIYLMMGLLPDEVKDFNRGLRKKYRWLPQTSRMSEDDLDVLRDLLWKRPHEYLDEIAISFGLETGKYFHPSAIWKFTTQYLGMSLQVLSKRASQQCAVSRHRFKSALAFLLQDDPERLMIVDESHKDRNASRRRRGWGVRNRHGRRELYEWFRTKVRYTLIAAADINGFVEGACDIVRRDEVSDEGASGTVDRDRYIEWVQEKLCPHLGNYVLGEKRSVVLLDNASIHMSYEVVDAISATGAVVIYGAPFSPDLSPIEQYFHMYKADF